MPPPAHQGFQHQHRVYQDYPHRSGKRDALRRPWPSRINNNSCFEKVFVECWSFLLEMLKSLTFGTADGGGCVGFCFFLFVCYYLRVVIHIYIYMFCWIGVRCPFFGILCLFFGKKKQNLSHTTKSVEKLRHMFRGGLQHLQQPPTIFGGIVGAFRIDCLELLVFHALVGSLAR